MMRSTPAGSKSNQYFEAGERPMSGAVAVQHALGIAVVPDV
jgi:hypothetical protein